MVRLKAGPDAGNVSWNGTEYPVVKGVVDVPDEAAAVLLGPGWGYTLARSQPAPEPEKEVSSDQ